jgi:hypothetical protein
VTFYPARALRRAVLIAVVVGTLLVVINHGDHLGDEPLCPHFFAKAALSYVVPFLVSLVTAWSSHRDRHRR